MQSLKMSRVTSFIVLGVLLLSSFLFVAAPASAAAPESSGCFYYKVHWGDTLFSIAWRYGDSVGGIAARNGIWNANYIRAGQSLLICPGYVPAPAPAYHKVGWGETLWSIAMRYGTTPWKIASMNYLPNLNLIYAGQVLRVL